MLRQETVDGWARIGLRVVLDLYRRGNIGTNFDVARALGIEHLRSIASPAFRGLCVTGRESVEQAFSDLIANEIVVGHLQGCDLQDAMLTDDTIRALAVMIAGRSRIEIIAEALNAAEAGHPLPSMTFAGLAAQIGFDVWPAPGVRMEGDE